MFSTVISANVNGFTIGCVGFFWDRSSPTNLFLSFSAALASLSAVLQKLQCVEACLDL